jgi:hypothetical protein
VIPSPGTEWASQADLKAVTIRQPWASAIFNPSGPRRKDVENRSWAIGPMGRLYIHAALKIDWTAGDLAWPVDATEEELPLGKIIGYVRITGCTQNAGSRWAARGQYHWLLGGPVLLKQPVPARGSLGIWRLPPEQAAEVAKQLAAP